MKWLIEFYNGKLLSEEKNNFEFNNLDRIKSIYFFDGQNKCGFYCKSGNFFINKYTYDFKIKLDNYIMVPFQSKTASIIFNSNQHNIESWNIGYKLINNEDYFEYKMSIYNNREIMFYAKNYDNNNQFIKERIVKLQ